MLPDNKVHVGVDIGGTKLLVLAEHKGEQSSKTIKTGPNFGPKEVEAALLGFLKDLNASAASVGFAIPGLVDTNGTVLASDVLPKLGNWSPKKSQALECPISVLNDAEAALVEASSYFNEKDTVLVIGVGTGIGSAIRLGATSIRKFNPLAAELGYIPISTMEGVKTLDQLAAGAAIRTKLKLSPEEIHSKIRLKDESTLTAIKEAGAALGLGLATTINLFCPTGIALYGGVLSYDFYLAEAIKQAKTYSLPESLKNCTFKLLDDAETVVARGALRHAQAALASKGKNKKTEPIR